MQLTGHTARQGASVQCMQAIEIERSPGLPSLLVTQRRRFEPNGVSFSFLQAVTQPLQSMQRSVSQINFILAAMSAPMTGYHHLVVPAQAGTEVRGPPANLDSRLRGNDGISCA